MALTEDQLQDQWTKAVDILEQTRVFADSLVGASSEFEVLTSALKGEFTPDALAVWAQQQRASLSSMIDPSRIYDAIAPCVLDYGKVLQAANKIGSGYETVPELMVAIYEYFAGGSERVESRLITLDIAQSRTGTGDGEMSRLIVDENNFQIDAVHVERKKWRCRRDQNTGVKKHAEEFEMVGETRSRDNLLNATHGSGSTQSVAIRNKNAGGGTAGSLLRNSSFSSYDAAATNKFTNWERVSGTEAIQSTLYYATYPGADTNASMLMGVSGASGTARYKQTLANMRVAKLNPNRPYFLRAMVNAVAGPGANGAGGNFVLHLGSQTVTVALSAIVSAGGWYEVMLPLNTNSWFKNFALGATSDDFDVEVEWTGWSAGDLLIDDVILCELDPVDGTWWVLRMNDATPVAWVVDDELEFLDTQSAGSGAAGGLINYYLFRAGLGYLPHATSSITFADPA